MLLLCGLALAEVDELGGYDEYNNNGNMMKLLILDVEEAAVVTGMQFYLENGRGVGAVSFVLYQDVGESYELVASVEASNLPDEEGFGDTGAVSWLLEPGVRYGLGAYLEGDWGYAYTEGQSADPWFGVVAGGLRVESGGVVDEFEDPGLEDYLYAMVLESSAADADGDGAVADTLGGDDCDDTDPMVLPGAGEVAYDGVDQDCDGVDLTDVDGDGAAADAAGGEDCDDTDPAVGPAAEDICGDAIDQDCSGSDSLCSGGEGLDISPGCGCASGTGPSGAALLGLSALALLRRRRA